MVIADIFEKLINSGTKYIKEVSTFGYIEYEVDEVIIRLGKTSEEYKPFKYNTSDTLFPTHSCYISTNGIYSITASKPNSNFCLTINNKCYIVPPIEDKVKHAVLMTKLDKTLHNYEEELLFGIADNIK